MYSSYNLESDGGVTNPEAESSEHGAPSGQISAGATPLAAVNLPPPPEGGPQRISFENQLLAGHYTGILESYGVKWTMARAARDTLQNFYDAEGTLENVAVAIHEAGIPFFKRYTVRIEGDAVYDYRKLLHLGGSGKENLQGVAGGFGEGAKIVALVLLRDFGFSQVRFAAGDWQLDFYMDEPPDGSYDEKVRGLHAKLTKVDPIPYNYVEFVTSSQKNAEAFENARELFYFPGHEHFKDPTMVVDLPDGSSFGYKLLPTGQAGYLYDCGQRRHFDTTTKWDNVPGMSIWTLGLCVFKLDRERGAVASDDLEEKMIKPMVAAMTREQLVLTLFHLEKLWPYGSEPSYGPKRKLLAATVEQMTSRGIKVQFPDQYVAEPRYCYSSQREFLKNKGLVVCDHSFARLGMPVGKIEEPKPDPEPPKPPPLPPRQRLTPTRAQKERMEVLRDMEEALIQANSKSLAGQIISKVWSGGREPWLYDPSAETGSVDTSHPEKVVWLDRSLLDDTFQKAMGRWTGSMYFKGSSTAELLLKIAADSPKVIPALKKRWETAGT